MQAIYDREVDLLTLKLADGTIDHAEETDGVIVHLSPDDRPLLVEVLGASDLLARISRLTATAPSGKLLDL